MSLTHILKSYDAIGVYPPRMDITLDLGFTGSSRLVTMFQSAFEQEALTLTCTSLERAPGGESLRLKGTAHLLGLENAAVDFLATERDGDLLVTLAVTLPSGWRFSTSFPDLPDDYDPLEKDEEQRDKPSFLDELSLGASTLVFSTQKHSSETYGAELLPGLNFVGELYFLGALMGLRTLTGKEGPVRISGPVREYRERPDPLEFLGLRLRGPIELATGDWPIPLSNPELYIKSPVDYLQVDHTVGFTQEPGIYLSADTRIAGRPARLISRYARQEDSFVLSFLGKMTDFALAGFSSLSQELGGDDVQAQMPEELQAPEGLRLNEFGITLDFTALQVLSVRVGLGCDTHWELVPDKLVLEEIGLSLQVLSPFSKGRTLSVALSAQVALQDVKLAVFAELPTLRFGGGLTLGETLPLGKVLESCCTQAPDLPELTVTQLIFEASPKEKTFALNCAMDDVLSLPVGATSFDVLGMGLAVDYARAGGSTGAFTAEMGIAGATAVISGELAGVFTLTGSLQKLDLKEFWSLVSGGEGLPEEIPDTVLENLTVSVSPKSGDFSLRGGATVDWDGLTGGAPLATQVQFAFSRDATGTGATRVSAIKASLSLQGSGSAPIADGFTLETFNLLFDYQTGTGWKLSGGATAEVLGNELRLQAGYETGTAGRKLKLQALAKPEATLIDLEGVGSYRFSQFDLTLDRRSVPGAKARTFFDLRVGSTLELKGLARVGGYLCIANTAEGASTLVFKPTAQSAAFSVDFPAGEGTGVRVELVELGFLQEAGNKGWSFTGTTYVGFTGIPSWLGEALPSRVFGKLVAGKNNVRISALNVTDPIDFTLPTVDGKKLGKAVVQLTELGVSLKPEPGLVVETGVGIPAELNTALFGGRQVFRVYQPGNLLSMARTRFTLSGTGIALRFLSSPFAGANAVVIQGESWFDVDLGEYGALQLKMPTFVYDGVTQYFEAGGGCKVTRPLALPLEPLKSFLTACGLEAAADIFPDKLPVTEVSLVDKDNNLQVDALISFLQRSGKFVPKEVVTALKKTGKLLDRFPDGFKQYLSIEVPQHLEFKFGFSPTGRVSLALLAPKKPVRVLFPSVVQSYVPMPGLTGIEVRKLTVGTLLSGSLFYAEVDAVIDQFDLPSLAVSLMLPSNPSFPLPTSDQLQRRIILDDVFCIVPLSQGLPIPLPVFYDELGFQYLGVEGLGLQSHISFPKPALDGGSAIAFFTALKQFISDRTTLLDPQRPPGGLDLAFTFHDEYLLAPEYLGGGVLGTKGKEFKIGLWKYVASMMNFCKRFSINDFIGAIPLEQRVGSAKYTFAFLKFDADWLLTTPGEFKKGSFERLKLSAGDRDDFMTVLPSVGSTPGQSQKSNEEGLVAFVRGKADLDFARLEAAFGLAASGAMGFNTGFRIAGAFGKTELELSGAVMVNAPLATDIAAAPALAPKASRGSRAVSFNGKNTWIELPASDSLMLPEYTIELWLRSPREQNGEWVEMFGIDTRQGGGQRNYFLAINTSAGFYHHRFADASGGNSGAPNTHNGSVGWGRWQHVALTNDGVIAKTYVDGKEASGSTVNGKLRLFKQPLSIGKSPGIPGGSFWKGEIAEIRIWKHARGQAEIESQMREVLKGDEQDLVSLYRFDEDTGERVVDVCGRNPGVLRNGSFVESDLLRLGGFEFDGKDDYVEVLDSESLRVGAYTAEAWIKPRKPKAQGAFSGVFGKKGRNHAFFLHSDGFVHHRFHSAAGWNDGAPNTPANVIAWDRWNHVAITNDGKTARTFVNGVQLSQGNVTGGLIIDNEALSIGRSADGGATNALYSGEISEIRLWSRARSPEELTGNMYRRLDGKDTSLVSLWRFSDASGEALVDACGRNMGRINREEALAPIAMAEPARPALQLQGHTHLTVAGHQVMRGDLRLVDDRFWFAGQLDLFPKEWPLQVTGHVEGWVSKQRFQVSGETRNALFGLTLSQSRLLMSNEQLQLEGKWLGAFLRLDVSWEKNDPVFAGSVGFSASPRLEFGVIRLAGVKVADNFRLSVDIAANVSLVVNRKGLAGDVTAKFKINGTGFELRVGFEVAPSDVAQLFKPIEQKLLAAPEKYLAHLFSDAATWLKNVTNGTLEFAKDSGEAVGTALSSAFKVSKEAATSMMKGAGYAAHQVGEALDKGYRLSAKEATRLLKDAGYAADQVGAALNQAYKLSAREAVGVLKDTGYAVDQVGAALNQGYHLAVNEATAVLKDAGYAVEDVGEALESAYKSSAEEAAKLLKQVGYDAKAVTKALDSAFGKVGGDCENLLKSAGFSSNDITGAVSGAVNAAGKELNKAKKKGKKLWKSIT